VRCIKKVRTGIKKIPSLAIAFRLYSLLKYFIVRRIQKAGRNGTPIYSF